MQMQRTQEITQKNHLLAAEVQVGLARSVCGVAVLNLQARKGSEQAVMLIPGGTFLINEELLIPGGTFLISEELHFYGSVGAIKQLSELTALLFHTPGSPGCVS